MKLFLLNIVLAVVWGLVSGEFTQFQVITGFVIGYGVLWLAQPVFEETKYFEKVTDLITFITFFVLELTVSSTKIARDVLSPKLKAKPGVIAIPLEAKTDLAVTLLANMISLTPGTLTLDIASDKSVLYVHAMYIEGTEKTRREIQTGLQRLLFKLLS